MSLRINLDKEEVKKLEYLKKIFGLKRNTEFLRFLLTKSYNDILSQTKLVNK